VPDAIAPAAVLPGSAFPFVTPVTFYGHESTDIPQDFQVADIFGQNQTSVTVQVPAGAKFLFVSAIDSFYGDNPPVSGYGVNITSVPEPASLLLASAGFAFLAGASRRRRGRESVR
jgi:hypothetical protein